MKKKYIIYGLILVVLLGGLFFRRHGGDRVTEVRTEMAQTGEIKSFLSTTAVVKSKDSKEYYGPQAKVLQLNVAVGDKVQVGDVLVKYETQDLSSTVKQAQIQYENAVLQRKDLYQQSKTLQDRIDDLDKQIKSAEKSQNPTDLAKLEALKQTRNQLSPISTEKLKQADNAVALAKLSLDAAKTKQSENKDSLVAENNGVVTAVNLVEGAFGNMGQPAVVVQDIENLKAVVTLGKFDAEKVKLGQEVLIRSGDKALSGVVSFIEPAAQKTISTSGSGNTLLAEIDINEKAPGLVIDFDVDIDILVGRVQNVVKVPIESIKFEKNNKSLIYVMEEKVARERAVTVGLQSSSEAEILTGLNVGERVILNPSTSIGEGVKVRELAEGVDNAGN